MLTFRSMTRYASITDKLGGVNQAKWRKSAHPRERSFCLPYKILRHLVSDEIGDVEISFGEEIIFYAIDQLERAKGLSIGLHGYT